MQELNTYQGVLCMNKPQNFTSFDVIGKLRGILHMKKLGHTGTLDPMATGVLPILVGRAARACDMLPDENKTYRAEVQFGITTDTEDIWGKQTAAFPDMYVTEEALKAVLPRFLGKISQIPPMYSAISIGGKRLYTLARQGIEVERPARQVRVDAIQLEAFDEAAQTAQLSISCGKGTYIRTLLADIGIALGGGAVMTSLCRTAACGFTLRDCYDFAQVETFCKAGMLQAHLISTDHLFLMYPALHLSVQQAQQYRNGVKLPLGQLTEAFPHQDLYRVYGSQEEFLGVGFANRETELFQVRKNF